MLEVGPGLTVQDVEPFAWRGGRPDLGWSSARVTARGPALLASASVIDSCTDDATTVTMRR